MSQITRFGQEEPTDKPKGRSMGPGHNRKERRRLARRAKLFKDKSGEAWRHSNAYMKLRRGIIDEDEL